MPKYPAVVADASPLISLEKLSGGFPLLAHTCTRLLVPEPVVQEISYFLESGIDYFDHHQVSEFVDVEVIARKAIPLSADLTPAGVKLGPGERYAISLARLRGLPLLVEERKARSIARGAGISVLGAAAVLKIAYERGGISSQSFKQQLQDLFRANRINRKVLDRMLGILPGEER